MSSNASIPEAISSSKSYEEAEAEVAVGDRKPRDWFFVDFFKKLGGNLFSVIPEFFHSHLEASGGGGGEGRRTRDEVVLEALALLLLLLLLLL